MCSKLAMVMVISFYAIEVDIVSHSNNMKYPNQLHIIHNLKKRKSIKHIQDIASMTHRIKNYHHITP